MRILGYFDHKENLDEFKTIKKLQSLFRLGIRCELCDRIRKNRRHTDPESEISEKQKRLIGTFLSEHGNMIAVLEEDSTYTVGVLDDFIRSILIKDITDQFMKNLDKILTEEERDFLIYHFVEGKSYKEIVEMCNLKETPDAIRMRVKRIQDRILKNEKIKSIKDDYLQMEEK